MKDSELIIRERVYKALENCPQSGNSDEVFFLNVLSAVAEYVRYAALSNNGFSALALLKLSADIDLLIAQLRLNVASVGGK